MLIRAHWLGVIAVEPSNVIKIDDRWLGGALGVRVELRDDRWFATSREEVQKLRAAMN
jgi:hypothetical protein